MPEYLLQTWHEVDARFGNEAGHGRKERKFNGSRIVQISDPKNLMHFNENARKRWDEQFDNVPLLLKHFLNDVYEIHNALKYITTLE